MGIVAKLLSETQAIGYKSFFTQVPWFPLFSPTMDPTKALSDTDKQKKHLSNSKWVLKIANAVTILRPVMIIAIIIIILSGQGAGPVG